MRCKVKEGRQECKVRRLKKGVKKVDEGEIYEKKGGNKERGKRMCIGGSTRKSVMGCEGRDEGRQGEGRVGLR